MKNFSDYKPEDFKDYKITVRMNPSWGGHITTINVKAPNKTIARRFGTGELNPHKILKIEEV